jgi:hypothetical protein
MECHYFKKFSTTFHMKEHISHNHKELEFYSTKIYKEMSQTIKSLQNS